MRKPDSDPDSTNWSSDCLAWTRAQHVTDVVANKWRPRLRACVHAEGW